jgi:hypothetical protein
MYYWHVEFRHHGQDGERNLWADSYEDVKVQMRLMFGTNIQFYKIERVNNG